MLQWKRMTQGRLSIRSHCYNVKEIRQARHGARDPTASKTTEYSALINKIHASVPAASLQGKYTFLANYTYTLGADQLTAFGQQEMVNSGIKFFNRYSQLTTNSTPFIRSSSEDRVVESAQNFSQGFHSARLASKAPSDPTYPYPMVIISEDDGSNNTLNHGLCTAFESGPDSDVGSNAQAIWSSIFIPPIQARLNANLPGANLTTKDTIDMMDLCPFNTVASPIGAISPFCDLFTESEWQDYDYYETLGKYYGYSHGNPFGPTQGAGWVEELLARLAGNHSFVRDDLYTSVNHTLDDDANAFPIGGGYRLFADFSHDNDMTAALAALGLYNISATGRPLSSTTREDPSNAGGYSAAWTVPFAARIYVEKMQCSGGQEELVRVLVNDRVVPLLGCGPDDLGRCRVGAFVSSLEFARTGGNWESCFS
ncbi:MAG: hypothetical protein M1820_008254 [Bogoriella megaspora]|nr:MAG: hypothetical protein M1820_008254 [Bogoriella megaspora]